MDRNFPVQFDGKSYDIKHFLRDHPGGVNTLINFRGKSVLQAMQKFGHSKSAYHMLNDFKVEGDVLEDVNLTGKVSGNGRIITSEEAQRDAEEIAFLEELEVSEKNKPSGSFLLYWEIYLKNCCVLCYVRYSRLDWSKPLLCQLEAIAPHYDKWVNSAVYRKCRLFASPLLESMTYTPWYLVPMFWIPIILYLGYTQFTEHVLCGDSCSQDAIPVAPMTLLQFTYHIAFGIMLWTIIEYTLHRWVFHLDPGSSITLIKVHFLIHGMHHKVPFDGLRQVFPPIPAFVLAASIYSVLHVGLYHPLIKLTGGLIGYLTYDMIHYYVHHGSPKDGTYLYAMKRYHSNHHFINHDRAFGISNKIWDHVFKTFVQVKKLSFSLYW